MKLVSFFAKGKETLGLFKNNRIINVYDSGKTHGFTLPSTMKELLEGGEQIWQRLADFDKSTSVEEGIPYEENLLLAPVPKPVSCRDGYAFRQHVATARRNRKAEMIPEFDQFPVFYFTNHNSIQGPGDVICMPDHFHKLDFELEVAIVIGKKGINIRAEEADQYIAGYMIMNDFSARTLQMEEMLLSLGPAKGKDFATATGPWLVTPDELRPYLKAPKTGHTGKQYNLEMKCFVNGKQVSYGNFGDMDWTFAEIIERCAYGTYIYPGDIIGSGTVGTGCFLELNGTALLNNPDYKPVWLKENDVVELEVSGLGILKNTIRRSEDEFSILARKKNS